MSEPLVNIQFKVTPNVAKYLMAFYVVYEYYIEDDLGSFLILDDLPSALFVLADALRDGHHNFSNLDWTDQERQQMKEWFDIE